MLTKHFRILTILVGAVLALSPGGHVRAASPVQAWTLAGHDLGNTRNNPDEHLITAANVGTLRQQWRAFMPGSLTGTPTVVNGTVYLPDTAGFLKAFDAATGAVRWTRTVTSYTGVPHDVTRNTAYAGGRLVFGDRPLAGEGARLVALDPVTGARLWSSLVDTQPTSLITGAPTIADGIIYVGISSREEELPVCCSFRGSVVAVDAATGRMLWKRWTAPVGYTGAAVWSSAPVVDRLTGLIYVGTGNNYTVPDGVCLTPTQTGCSPPARSDYQDSLLALRLSDGAPAWALPTLQSDVSSHACPTPVTCGPDFDFGTDPNLFTAVVAGQSRELVGIGQKSGFYWAADAATGSLVWVTRVGPGGAYGGIEWGTATDGQRIYVAETNSGHQAWTLRPGGRSTNGGFWSALDPATGAILWQTADPQGAEDFGYVSVANGVVYAGSGAATGTTVYALSASTGAVRWTWGTGGSVMGGAAIVDGRVYWASGYYRRDCPQGQPACAGVNALFSFGLAPG